MCLLRKEKANHFQSKCFSKTRRNQTQNVSIVQMENNDDNTIVEDKPNVGIAIDDIWVENVVDSYNAMSKTN